MNTYYITIQEEGEINLYSINAPNPEEARDKFVRVFLPYINYFDYWELVDIFKCKEIYIDFFEKPKEI